MLLIPPPHTDLAPPSHTSVGRYPDEKAFDIQPRFSATIPYSEARYEV
jgi:hypothetical protein